MQNDYFLWSMKRNNWQEKSSTNFKTIILTVII